MAVEPRSITPLIAGTDNYMYLVRGTDNQALIVDPADASTVSSMCTLLGLKLTHILVTHSHRDHTDGVGALVKKYSCAVIGFDQSKIPSITQPIVSDTPFIAAGLSCMALTTPGHTTDGCCYYMESLESVFTGDTLFLAGCGRLLGGNAEQLYASLKKLAALPDQTKVWCGHEYTLENIAFARWQLPENAALAEREQQVNALYDENEMTIPGTIAQEKLTNPFLLAADPKALAAVRKLKDSFA